MPVTVKLSRKFYERFGEDIANELVELLNNVHTTFRGDLRELNESNFARFEGKLAEMNGRWEGRFAAFDAKLVEMNGRWEARFAAFDAKLEQRLAEYNRDLADRLAQLESRLTWRMFAFWAPTALAVIGSSAGVISLLLRR
jgi:anti-sigma-K factor RskA